MTTSYVSTLSFIGSREYCVIFLFNWRLYLLHIDSVLCDLLQPIMPFSDSLHSSLEHGSSGRAALFGFRIESRD